MLRVNIQLRDKPKDAIYVGKQFMCVDVKKGPVGKAWTIYMIMGDKVYYKQDQYDLSCSIETMKDLFRGGGWIPIN